MGTTKQKPISGRNQSSVVPKKTGPTFLPKKQKWFWCVWNSKGKTPTRKHFKQEKAAKEAKRLSLLNPGFNFYVLEAIDVFNSKEAR